MPNSFSGLQLLKAAIISSWRTNLARAERFLTNRNNYLLFLFFIYLVLIPCFALIYTLLYRGDPHRFSFNQDIARAQHEIMRASTQREVEHQNRLLEQLRHLSTYLSESEAPKLQFAKWYDTYSLKVYSDQYHYECGFRFLAGGGPFGGADSIPLLIIRKTDGHEIEKFDLPNNLKCPDTLEGARLFSANLVMAFEQDLAQTQTVLKSLGDESPEVWSYWDFVYFSTVTQTTVGYGDIVPNSTSVRVFVVAQLIIGTALLVVGLNLIVRSNNDSGNRTCTQVTDGSFAEAARPSGSRGKTIGKPDDS